MKSAFIKKFTLLPQMSILRSTDLSSDTIATPFNSVFNNSNETFSLFIFVGVCLKN